MEWLFIFLKGFAMGAANVIPGVSGGTVAFITGIYERLLNAIKSFDMQALRLIQKKRIGDLIKHIDLWFLVALGSGVVGSIASLAKVLKWAYVEHEVCTSALFFGLIALSILSVARMVKKWNVACFVAVLLGCAFAVSLAFFEHGGENRDHLYLVLCGAVAMCSMIMPGVSGSFVLILMGNYMLILNSVNDLRSQQFDKALPIIIPVGIGAVLGVAILSRFLSWLFKKFHDVTTALITGFVAGSLYVIWPWKTAVTIMIAGKEKVVDFDRYRPEIDNVGTWYAIGFIAIGAVIMFAMDYAGKKKSA